MSFCVFRKENKLMYKYDKIYSPYCSNIKFCEEKIIFDQFELHKIEEIFMDNLENENLDELLKYETVSYCVINKKKNNIEVFNSLSGLVPIFYYKTEEKFCVSDNFWDMIDYIKPTYKMLDNLSIKEHMATVFPLFDTTFILGMKYLMPGFKLYYDILKKDIRLERKFELTYNSKISDINLAKINFESRMNKMFSDVKEECGDVIYGVGVSGGLDSRIIPYFAQKFNMRLSGFILGNKRPHYLLKSQDHKNAALISKYYNISLKELKWDKSKLLDKIDYEIKVDPLGSCEFFKFEEMKNIHVLIHGGNGYIVGSSLPHNIEELSSDDLMKRIRELGRLYMPNTLFNMRINKVFKFVLNKEIEIKHYEKWYDYVFPKEIEREIERKLNQFIKKEKERGKNNISIFEEYFHGLIGARNKYGAFESQGGKVRSFSIYLPGLLEESMKWDSCILENREVLKEFIFEKIPELSKIAEQNYKGRLLKEEKSLYIKIIDAVKFALRGNGTSTVEQKFFRKSRKIFLNAMFSGTGWFYRIFPIEENVGRISKFDNPRVACRLWKIKLVLDAIENKKYTKYICQSNEKEILVIDE